MSEATTISVRLSEAIAEGMLELAPDEVRIVLATYHLLSLGDPVLPSEIADEAGVDLSVVESRLASWPGVFKQDRALIGFWGLALPEMSHRFEVEGRTLHTWCAYDALFLPELIGKKARVRSKDPVTGEEITLTVHPDRVEDLSSETIVISFLDPTTTRFDENVILNFCNYVHFFTSPESAEKWISEHPGTFSLSINEASRLARLTNRAKFGEVLDKEATAGGVS